ncbi:hypothetical protein [Rugamonas apoptosis]|uniref:Uncharacterized protein n=1 Tax=Rugamonas apoptosis TaxID=2758570 RepID=A0A7W2FF17_9BURK|nr:hypothetical protein [Rugamonas apoptosis]MBA5690536.1 hypothetical protein [Rugamonas apoptosis]
MTDKNSPICGADLERWRLANGLTMASAADALGLQTVRWSEYTNDKNAALPIPDPAVAILLQLYTRFPDSSPIARSLDIREFSEALGFEGSRGDVVHFAALIGRSKASAHRLLRQNGTPGRPTIRLADAIRRLSLTKEEALRVLTQVVEDVGSRQGRPDVLERGWEGSE